MGLLHSRCVTPGSKLKEARGFVWPDELRHLRITHLELEAVFETMQSFMRDLQGKVVRLYCDNQAVVAMLLDLTSRNPELMRRMRKLWLLLDLHDIELQARYIRSEANEWADRLSRCEDIDDWRLNRRCGTQSCSISSTGRERRRQRGAAAIATSTPAAAVPAGTRLTLYWELDDAWYPGVVQLYRDGGGFANIVYDDGDEEVVDLAEEKFSVIDDVEITIGEKNALLTDSVGTSSAPPVGTEENKIKKTSFLEQAFCLRWRTELGISEHSELAVQMQEAALQPTTKVNYEPKVKKIQASSMQQYLSAINGYHEDLGYEAPAKGRSVTRAVKGMTVLQASREMISGDILTERAYLPAQHVRAVAQQAATASTPKTSEELRQLRAYV
eukprot:gene8481-biopygen8602